MARPLFTLLAAAAGMLLATAAQALSLGDLQVRSHLGEPLEAAITLGALDGLDASELIIAIADEKTYQTMGIARLYSHTRLRFEAVTDKARDRGEIRIRSLDPLREPQLQFVLEIRWPKGRMMKSYTVLIDPSPLP